jgi:hypothetical protein
MFMEQEVSEQLVGLLSSCEDRGMVDTDAQRKAVNEGPHDAVGSLTTVHTPEENSSEDNITLAGGASEHHRPG